MSEERLFSSAKNEFLQITKKKTDNPIEKKKTKEYGKSLHKKGCSKPINI